jgi:hypothetical protein
MMMRRLPKRSESEPKDLQERRVKVLGAVAEEIERGHQQDRIDAQTPM